MGMELHLSDLILSTVVIIGLMSASALICQKLKLPGIVGFIIAGVVIGPNALGFIDSIPGASLIAELGVIFLLFTIGLELSFQKLRKNWKLVTTVGFGQVAISVTFFAMICHFLISLTWAQSILWGCLISLSSSAIMMKLLIDNREMTSPYGIATTGILLSQDVLVIPMTLGLALFANNFINETADFSISYQKILIGAGQFVGVVIALIISAKYIVPFVLEKIVKTKNRELFFFSVLLLCLGFALVFEKLNLSLALGAFLSGLVISESHFGKQATSEIIVLRDSFLALFFLSVGMLLDLNFVVKNFLYIILFTLLTIIGKVLIGAVIVMIARIPIRSAIICGLFIAQIGELSFVIAEQGTNLNLLSPHHFQYFLSITIITMMIAPFIFSFAPRFVLSNARKSKISHPKDAKEKPMIDALVIGYGIAGQALVSYLQTEGKSYNVIEQNYELVKKARTEKVPVIYGDGSTIKTLYEAGFPHTKVVVVCVAGVVVTNTIVENIMRFRPDTTVVVRVQYRRESLLLENVLNKNMIIDSETISARRLVAKVKSLLDK